MDLAAVLIIIDCVSSMRSARVQVALRATHRRLHLLLTRDCRSLYHASLAHVISSIHHFIEDLLLSWLCIRLVLFTDDAISRMISEREEVCLCVESPVWHRLVALNIGLLLAAILIDNL